MNNQDRHGGQYRSLGLRRAVLLAHLSNGTLGLFDCLVG